MLCCLVVVIVDDDVVLARARSGGGSHLLNFIISLPVLPLFARKNAVMLPSHRFDVRRAYKTGIMQKLKDVFGVGGHVYGYGAYFAAEAFYSHWWSTRIWHRGKKAKSVHAMQ